MDTELVLGTLLNGSEKGVNIYNVFVNVVEETYKVFGIVLRQIRIKILELYRERDYKEYLSDLPERLSERQGDVTTISERSRNGT